LDDAGVYKVVAINSGGKASSQCTLIITRMYNYIHIYLFIHFLAASHISNVINQEKEKKEPLANSVPKFVKFPTDLLVAESEDAIFECVVIGEPKPDLRWYSDDGEMIYNERILVSIIIYLAYNIFHLTLPQRNRLEKGKMEQLF